MKFSPPQATDHPQASPAPSTVLHFTHVMPYQEPKPGGAPQAKGIPGSSRSLSPLWLAGLVTILTGAFVMSFVVGYDVGRSYVINGLFLSEKGAGNSGSNLHSNGRSAPVGTQGSNSSSYASKIQIVSVLAERGENALGQKGAVINLKVKNTGDKTIDDLVLTVFFLDTTGSAIYDDDFAIASSNSTAQSTATISNWDLRPIKPNYVRQRNGVMSLNVPSEWKEGSVTVKVKSVSVE